MLGTSELIVIALVIFVLFGSSAIPKFAKSLGQAKAAFKEGERDQPKDEKKEETEKKDNL